jgi:hypothetical protein
LFHNCANLQKFLRFRSICFNSPNRAIQPDDSANIVHHHGACLVQNETLVDLEKELQVAIRKSVVNWISYLHNFSWIFLIFYLFSWAGYEIRVYCKFRKAAACHIMIGWARWCPPCHHACAIKVPTVRTVVPCSDSPVRTLLGLVRSASSTRVRAPPSLTSAGHRSSVLAVTPPCCHRRAPLSLFS